MLRVSELFQVVSGHCKEEQQSNKGSKPAAFKGSFIQLFRCSFILWINACGVWASRFNATRFRVVSNCFKLFQGHCERNDEATRVQSLRRSRVRLIFYSVVLLFYGSRPSAFKLRVQCFAFQSCFKLFQIVSGHCEEEQQSNKSSKPAAFKGSFILLFRCSFILLFNACGVWAARFNATRSKVQMATLAHFQIFTLTHQHINTSAH